MSCGVFVYPGDKAKWHAMLLLIIVSDWRKARPVQDYGISHKIKLLSFDTHSAYGISLADPDLPVRGF